MTLRAYGLTDLARCVLTNGTVSVDFLNTGFGFHLKAWTPREAGRKGGGVYQDSPLTDGRRPVWGRFASVEETFELAINEKCPDALYDRQIRDLRLLCQEAFAFFENRYRSYNLSFVYNPPVWMEVRGKKETNIRYAIVSSASLPEEENPLGHIIDASPGALVEGVTFTWERNHWQDVVPERASPLEISGMSEYMDLALGNVYPVIPPELDSFRRPTDETLSVLVSNKQQVHNLTHVFRFEDGVGWSTNLMDDGPPMQLFRAAGTLVDDLMVYGIVDDPINFTDGVFSSLVHWITDEADGEVVSIPEYYDGVGWVALDYQGFGYNGNFVGVGLDTIHWRMPDDWAQFDPAASGDTGYYIRLRVTSVSGTGRGPIAEEYLPYTIAWAHTHVEPGTIGGDIPALIEVRFRNASDKSGVELAPAPSIHANRVICGLRSLSRDYNLPNVPRPFTPYIDLGGLQNQDQDITVSYFDVTTAVASTLGWGQRIALYDPGMASPMTQQISVVIEDGSLSYYGAYHMFLRARQIGGSARQALVQMVVSFGSQPIYTSDPVEIPAVEGNNLLDMGATSFITDQAIGFNYGNGPLGADVRIDIYVQCLADLDVELYDLIVMPIDEWYGDFTDVVGTSTLTALGDVANGGSILYIDSATWQKGVVRALLQGAASGQVETTWEAVASGPAILQVNKGKVTTGQRLWFLFAKRHDATFDEDDWRSNHEHGNYIEVKIVQRYLGARGTG